MSLNAAMRASTSGLFAERTRMDVISANIANANSVRTDDEDAYHRQMVVLVEAEDGVKIGRIMPDKAPLKEVYDPSHPFANAEGVVFYSNVNPIVEMVNLMSATRSYEANIQAFNSAKSMVRSALNIGRV